MREVYESRFWRETVALSVAVLVSVLLLELAFSTWQAAVDFAAIEALALCVIGSNLAMGFAVARSRRQFLASHALDVLLLLPALEVLRFAEYDYAFMRLFRLGSHFSALSEGAGYALGVVKYRIG